MGLPFHLEPYTFYDSWDADTACQLIVLGCKQDIEKKRRAMGWTGPDPEYLVLTARTILGVYDRAKGLADAAVNAGVIKEHDTIANWLAWAHSKGYDVSHLSAAGISAQHSETPAPMVAEKHVRAYTADLGIEVTVEKTRLRKLPPKEAARWENADTKDNGKRDITSQYAGLSGACLMTLPEFCDEVEKRLLKWRNGQYLVCEAAQILADANPGDDVMLGIDAGGLCRQMEDAIHAAAPHTKKLTVRFNGIPVAADSITEYRVYLHTVLHSDVNEWLKNMGAGYALNFPYQTTDAGVKAAPCVTDSATGGLKPDKAKRRTWRDVAWRYVLETFKAGQFSTAKSLYYTLESKAGSEDSPFDKGTGVHRYALYVREIGNTVTLKTIQNAWPKIKASGQTK